MTLVAFVAEVSDGLHLSVRREVETFAVQIGAMRVSLSGEQLVVRTGPDGAGAVELLRVSTDAGARGE